MPSAKAKNDPEKGSEEGASERYEGRGRCPKGPPRWSRAGVHVEACLGATSHRTNFVCWPCLGRVHQVCACPDTARLLPSPEEAARSRQHILPRPPLARALGFYCDLKKRIYRLVVAQYTAVLQGSVNPCRTALCNWVPSSLCSPRSQLRERGLQPPVLPFPSTRI